MCFLVFRFLVMTTIFPLFYFIAITMFCLIQFFFYVVMASMCSLSFLQPCPPLFSSPLCFALSLPYDFQVSVGSTDNQVFSSSYFVKFRYQMATLLPYLLKSEIRQKILNRLEILAREKFDKGTFNVDRNRSSFTKNTLILVIEIKIITGKYLPCINKNKISN